jgi:hypothetical protein
LGGVTFDQSFRLEPVQVAGFNQAFRSIIPESVAGANAAARFGTWGLSFEQKAGRGTFLGVSAEVLESKANRVLGSYDFHLFSPITSSEIRERLDYRERSLILSASQLLGREWSLGAHYRLSEAELKSQFPGAAASAILFDGNNQFEFPRRRKLEGVLHQASLFAIYNHRSGFFGEAQANWYGQHSQGYVQTGLSQDLPSDDFWQFNLFAGYRFAQRRAELRLGLLNIADQDYRLNPLNLTSDLPRERTLLASFRFYF